MDPCVYGDIGVELVSEHEKEDWTVREFKLSSVREILTSLLESMVGSSVYVCVVALVIPYNYRGGLFSLPEIEPQNENVKPTKI